MATFNPGAPPAIGWWLTLNPSSRVLGWRWWNGMVWSVTCNPINTAAQAAHCAACSTMYSQVIEWSDYYPTDARVPR